MYERKFYDLTTADQREAPPPTAEDFERLEDKLEDLTVAVLGMAGRVRA